MTLTKKQEEMLYLLRLDGLRREITLHEAEEAYKNASAKENNVKQYVLDHNEYYADSVDNDPMNGQRITSTRDDFMMNENIFVSDYLPKIKAAFMDLYGIDNPLEFVYSEPFRAASQQAEKDYLMIAVDFLKISKAPQAETLEKSVKGYMRDELKKKLIALNTSFIGGDRVPA